MTRLLLVDDDPAMTRVLGRALGVEGFEVQSTNRSFGVLNLIAELQPDVVLMDLLMPGLDGDELVSLIREDPELARTRVILWSGLDPSETGPRAQAAGADGFLQKTGDIDAIVRALRPAPLADAVGM